jgi:7,8-dihydropterin-6-yl-methyl-4-(beta-D-ribofuranosyl)aminobenzene 5'-phosphate synthase
MMEIKITTLTENTANYGFLAEWGLSMLVEVEGLKILIDFGLSFSAVYNAQIMGIDLSSIDRIVLSHGHADHIGGLRDILRIKKEVGVIAHPDIWTSKYTRRDGHDEGEYIGIPFSREELESQGARFNLTREPVRISENVMTTGEVPMLSGYEKIEDNLFVKEGIVNTLRHAQSITGKELVYAAIGGTHLFRASAERIEKTIADLKDMGLQKLGASHCTGFRASARLAEEFEGAFFLNNAGTRFTLP